MDRVSDNVGSAPLSVTAYRYRPAGPRQILGIWFFSGGASEAVERMRAGGLLVAPAAPALTSLPRDEAYREALLEADLAIVDSALMAVLWNVLEGTIWRASPGWNTSPIWSTIPNFASGARLFMSCPAVESARKNVTWLVSQGIPIGPEHAYIAPMYGDDVA